MGIMFQNFDKKVPDIFFTMGFDAHENAKNHVFQVFGSLSQLSDTTDGSFFTDN